MKLPARFIVVLVITAIFSYAIMAVLVGPQLYDQWFVPVYMYGGPPK